MTPRKPRAIGTATETAVARYLVGAGFPHCERRSLRGTHDAGDLTGTPGICWSVKGGRAAKEASDFKVKLWLDSLERQRVNAAATVGVLVLQRAGIGEANAGRWWAILTLDALVTAAVEDPYTAARHWAVATNPVRMHLADMCTLLRAAGYGTPLEVDA